LLGTASDDVNLQRHRTAGDFSSPSLSRVRETLLGTASDDISACDPNGTKAGGYNDRTRNPIPHLRPFRRRCPEINENASRLRMRIFKINRNYEVLYFLAGTTIGFSLIILIKCMIFIMV
jgi:hypothetical protein